VNSDWNTQHPAPSTRILETVIKISENQADLANDLAGELSEMINRAAARQRALTVALSGGRTPEILFMVLGSKYSEITDWNYVHFFWGDERCVKPDDPESNFGMTCRTFLNKIKIPESNIHRIRGEEDPGEEAIRYAGEIRSVTKSLNNLPAFDLIILGLGDDGHTASIFPDFRNLLSSKQVCEVSAHPQSRQKRITLTGPVINNAFSIIFLVTGLSKAEIVSDIIDRPGEVDYPAASIEPMHGTLKWYLDRDAASMLSQWA